MPARLRSFVLGVLSLGLFGLLLARQDEPAKEESAEGLVPALAQKRPAYWKGNLHTHSLWSDGDDFPEMIADWYKRNGYNFLALTDHNILAQGQKWVDASRAGPKGAGLERYRKRFGDAWVETRQEDGKTQVRLKPLAEFRSLLEEPMRFLMVPGEEITHRYAKLPVHINGINIRDVILPVDGPSVAETITVNHRSVYEQREATGQPMLAFLNHPNWGWGVRAEDILLAEQVRYFEVFNGHPGVRNYGDETHPGTERMWDIVLAVRLGKLGLPPVLGLATDDAHRYHEWGVGKVNPGRGWIMVKAPYLSAEAIVKAMEAGDFYFSTGVSLADVRREGNELTVEIDAEPGVTYTTQFIATMKDAPLTSTPRLDGDGKPLPVTAVYSDEIGKVVHEATGPKASYQLTGKELYVRAKVTSTKPHPNPYAKGDVQVAWTQPVRP